MNGSLSSIYLYSSFFFFFFFLSLCLFVSSFFLSFFSYFLFSLANHFSHRIFFFFFLFKKKHQKSDFGYIRESIEEDCGLDGPEPTQPPCTVGEEYTVSSGYNIPLFSFFLFFLISNFWFLIFEFFCFCFFFFFDSFFVSSFRKIPDDECEGGVQFPPVTKVCQPGEGPEPEPGDGDVLSFSV